MGAFMLCFVNWQKKEREGEEVRGCSVKYCIRGQPNQDIGYILQRPQHPILILMHAYYAWHANSISQLVYCTVDQIMRRHHVNQR